MRGLHWPGDKVSPWKGLTLSFASFSIEGSPLRSWVIGNQVSRILLLENAPGKGIMWMPDIAHRASMQRPGPWKKSLFPAFPEQLTQFAKTRIRRLKANHERRDYPAPMMPSVLQGRSQSFNDRYRFSERIVTTLVYALVLGTAANSSSSMN